MAAITSAIVSTGTALYGAKKQSDAAKDAARMQAQGVQQGIEATQQATQQALPYLQGGFDQARQDVGSGYDLARQATATGYDQGMQTLSPLAGLAGQYTGETSALLGLQGDQAYQDALSRVSDPLAAEQERTLLRNSAQLGGVGGNQLAALADMTRARTESNIGSRLGQLGMASTPALNALQQIAQMRLGRGSDVAGNLERLGSAQGQLSAQGGTTTANTIIGQGSDLTQLAQNLGTARAGGPAFQAQQAPALVQGLNAGISGYLGAGGTFGTPPPQNPQSMLQPIASSMPNMGNMPGTINLPRY